MLANAGFELTQSVFMRAELEALELSGGDAGVRSLLDVGRIREFARDERLLRIAGPGAFAVRAILFDKSSDANWALGWHQDSSIAVMERADVEGFGPWTTKDEVPHAIAPVALLESMISLRVHLDDCGEDNGPLRVIAGSHRFGRMSAAQISTLIECDGRGSHEVGRVNSAQASELVERVHLDDRGLRQVGRVNAPQISEPAERGHLDDRGSQLSDAGARAEATSCLAASGDVLAFKPLLLHASSSARVVSHRRVLQLEYAFGPLPAPLRWRWS